MSEIKISPRLKKIADMVEPFPCIDIGADHGYLDLYLVQRGHKGQILATENKKGPYKRLCDNIAKNSFSDYINCLFADGLDFDYRDYQEVIIAGMGGKQIANILSSAKYGLNNFLYLILEPQSDAYTLRKVVDTLGFKAVCEIYLNEQEKTYPVIKCIKGHDECDETMFKYGKFSLENNDRVLYKYLIKNKIRIDRLLQSELISKSSKNQLKRQLNQIKEGLRYYE